MMGEALIGGTSHADNVGPAVLGGVVLIRGYEPLDIVRLPVPEGFFLCRGASRHRGQYQGGARGASPRGTPARCRDAVGQCPAGWWPGSPWATWR